MLGERFDLTIAHAGESIGSKSFNETIVKEKKMGPFFSYQIRENLADYHVLIVYLNLRFLNMYKYIFSKQIARKLILSGIGVAGSYTKKYDSSRIVPWIVKKLLKRVKAAVFYERYPEIKYQGLGIAPNKLFSAPNTVWISNNKEASRLIKNSFLFIGSLYKEKGINLLIDAYRLAEEKNVNLPLLHVIGDGPDRNEIQELVKIYGLDDKINIHGAITEDKKLVPFFQSAYCCVSPFQAGLSVQKSFAFGVPFLTCKYPITGGEYAAIIDGVNGFFYDGTSIGLLEKLCEIPNLADLEKISENSREYYERFNSPEVWLKGFQSAIEYTVN